MNNTMVSQLRDEIASPIYSHLHRRFYNQSDTESWLNTYHIVFHGTDDHLIQLRIQSKDRLKESV